MGDIIPLETNQLKNLDRICKDFGAEHDQFLLDEGLQLLANYRSIGDVNDRRNIFNLVEITAARRGLLKPKVD
jgi:hypothetical protein